MKPRQLVLSTILLFLFGTGTALAQVQVDEHMTGPWGDPAHNGEGFVLEVLDGGLAVVYWFTYDESGNQRWFLAVGAVDGATIQFDELLQTSGPEFGDNYNPGNLEYTVVGSLTLSWSDCENAVANYTVNGVAGSQDLSRISALAGLGCIAPGSAPSTMTGSWGDQTHDGEGLVMQVLDNGTAVVFWFSYDADGRQSWFYGLGQIEGDVVRFPELLITRGGRFGPDYDPVEVESETWGSLEVSLGCDYGKFDYESAIPEYGSGKQTVVQLTHPGEPECDGPESPNILLIIADDLGLDASNQYAISAELPSTPALDQLAAQGLVFDNAWSSPTCTPTRAGILTGKYGSRTGMLAVGDVLSAGETSLQSFIRQHLPGKYTDAVIGKWHVGPARGGLDHPESLGIGHYAGIINGGVEAYDNWVLTTDGVTSEETDYVTSKLVDLAVDWTAAQDQPWFLWLAFNAPHTPFHLPPEHLHGRQLPGTEEDIAADPLPYYFAAIEAMDAEIDRLLASLDPETRDNTIVIFMGDNGTPARVAQSPFGRQKAKDTLYQGGINVPFMVSGPGVSRAGEREAALVNTTDLFATIAALAGVNVEEIHDSISFADLLEAPQASRRLFQFSEQATDTGEAWAISDGIYKLIASTTGAEELFQLTSDPYENNDLLSSGGAPAGVVEDLRFLASNIRNGAVPNLPESYFNYANIEWPAHYYVNRFPAQSQFQGAAIDSDNTPVDNPVTDAGATLGRVLFYDQRLSANGTVACASCHQQQFGFSDPATLSQGFEGGLTRRHSMGLANARFYLTGRFFWDERAAALEDQVLMPFQDPVEMGLTLEELEQIVRDQPYYPPLFAEAFGDDTIDTDRISRALAQFVRSIVSTSSRYDQARSEVDSPVVDFPAFTAEENLGKDLFFGPVTLDNGQNVNCAGCHATEAFIGVIPRGPLGTTIATSNGLDEVSTDDLGVFESTGNSNDIGKFKTPSLANIAVTAPYMHDGRFATLEEVIDHYSAGIQNHANLSPPLVGPDGQAARFNFTEAEKAALVQFLNTLTDEAMLSDEKYSDPFD